jgi:hypothetical protein
MLISAKDPMMSSLHSLLDNLLAAGSLYGWRVDAIVLGAILWLLTTGSSHVRLSLS